MKNLFYDLPDELQRKIELLRPTNPVAELIKQFIWVFDNTPETYGENCETVGDEKLTDALMTLRYDGDGELMFQVEIDALAADKEYLKEWEAEQEEEDEFDVDEWLEDQIDANNN